MARGRKYTVDTKAPTATITMSDSALIKDETSTVTITFSENVTSFELADLSAESGVLSDLVQDANDSKKYTAKFTPTADIEDKTNVITLANSYTDRAGNTGTTATSANYEVDTKAPTATITMSDNALIKGEISTVTITFSENVTNFDNADVTVENGTLSEMTSSDGGITWSGTFTPMINANNANNAIVVSNDYTDMSGNNGVGQISDNYSVSTVDLSFYSWNGLNGYNTVQENISDENLTIYLNYDTNFNENAQILEANNEDVWMLVSGEPTTQMIDQWIDQVLEYNANGGNLLGLSLDIEPWVNFADQNDPANKDEWQKFLDFTTYVSDSLHSNNLALSTTMPFWLDNINNDVFPNNRPIIYDIIDISDEVIIMDYTTNQTNFVNFAVNELAYADSVDKSIKLAIETTDLGDDNLSFYNNPQAMIPFLQTSFSNQSFDGYTIHAMDTFANLSPTIVI